MSDRTGRALGTLDPVIYFRNASLKTYKPDRLTTVHLPYGHYILPPVEIGKGPRLARMLWEQRYKPQGYDWCEAGTLNEVDKLQEILVDQEDRINRERGQRMEGIYNAVKARTASNLRQRMISKDCTPYEKDFIQLWLMMEPEKRKKYTQRFSERIGYIWAREMDSRTRVEDRMRD